MKKMSALKIMDVCAQYGQRALAATASCRRGKRIDTVSVSVCRLHKCILVDMLNIEIFS